MFEMRYISYLFFTVLIFSASCSVSKKLEKRLGGKYFIKMIDTENSGAEFSGGIMSDILKGSYINFGYDGTYEMSVAGKKFEGNWRVSEDGKKILTDNSSVFFNIVTFSDDKFVLESVRNGKKIFLHLVSFSE